MKLHVKEFNVDICHDGDLWIISDSKTCEFGTGKSLRKAYNMYVDCLFSSYRFYKDAEKNLSDLLRERFEEIKKRVSE